MLILGLLSFFQIILLPGLILILSLRIKTENKLEFIVYAFAFSLLINYNLVYFLTLLKIYTSLTMYIVLGLELVAIAFFVFKRRSALGESFTNTALLKNPGAPRKALLILAIVVVFSFFYFFFDNLGTVFTGWDPVFSWNRWAIDWYLNKVPTRTYLYPQLIPANFSISYQLMQNHYIQMFPKAIMPLFTVFTGFLFLSFYLIKKDTRTLFSALVFSGAILIFGLKYIDSGYVDIAVAFFSFAAVYETLKGGRLTNKRIVVILMLASAAAVTKFVGLLVFTYCLGWILFNIFKKSEHIFMDKRNYAAIIMTLLTALHLHWYLVKAIQILMGIEYSYIRFLTQDIHHDLNLIGRFAYGLGRYPLWTAIIFFVLVFFSVLSLFEKRSILISAVITLPLILIWGFYFSYDERNLLVAIPFLSLSSVYGLAFIVKKAFRLPDKEYHLMDKYAVKRPGKGITWLKKRQIIIFSLIVFISISVFLLLGSGKIYESQLEKQKTIGQPDLNRLLYEYRGKNEIDGKIITDYYWATALPGFEGSTIQTFKENDAFIIISNSDSYELVNPIDLADKGTFGFLISDIYFLHFYGNFMEMVRDGDYEIVFELGDYHFIRILNNR